MPVKTKRLAASGTLVRGFVPGPPPPPMPTDFPNKRTSGLFSAPKEAKVIDWAVENGNASTAHWLRVTVYKCPSGAAKTAIAGPTAVYLSPANTTHLAVTLTTACKSDYYEVVMEDEDLMLHPCVQMFRKYPAGVIVGTLIPAGDFEQTQQ